MADCSKITQAQAAAILAKAGSKFASGNAGKVKMSIKAMLQGGKPLPLEPFEIGIGGGAKGFAAGLIQSGLPKDMVIKQIELAFPHINAKKQVTLAYKKLGLKPPKGNVSIAPPEPPTIKTPKVQPTLATDATAQVDDVLYKQIGKQQGSNPGGTYRGADGVDRYVKFVKPEHAYNEALANGLYEAMGVDAVVSRVGVHAGTGQSYVANTIVKGKTMEMATITQKGIAAEKVVEGHVADMVLANFDAVGLTLDNILIDAQGVVRRIDNGGALLYRAQGAKKTSSMLTTIEFDLTKNKAYASIFDQANVDPTSLEFRTQLTNKWKSISGKVKSKYGGWEDLIETEMFKLDQQLTLDLATREELRSLFLKRVKMMDEYAAGLEKTVAKTEEIIATVGEKQVPGWGKVLTQTEHDSLLEAFDMAVDATKKAGDDVLSVLKAQASEVIEDLIGYADDIGLGISEKTISAWGKQKIAMTLGEKVPPIPQVVLNQAEKQKAMLSQGKVPLAHKSKLDDVTEFLEAELDDQGDDLLSFLATNSEKQIIEALMEAGDELFEAGMAGIIPKQSVVNYVKTAKATAMKEYKQLTGSAPKAKAAAASKSKVDPSSNFGKGLKDIDGDDVKIFADDIEAFADDFIGEADSVDDYIIHFQMKGAIKELAEDIAEEFGISVAKAKGVVEKWYSTLPAKSAGTAAPTPTKVTAPKFTKKKKSLGIKGPSAQAHIGQGDNSQLAQGEWKKANQGYAKLKQKYIDHGVLDEFEEDWDDLAFAMAAKGGKTKAKFIDELADEIYMSGQAGSHKIAKDLADIFVQEAILGKVGGQAVTGGAAKATTTSLQAILNNPPPGGVKGLAKALYQANVDLDQIIHYAKQKYPHVSGVDKQVKKAIKTIGGTVKKSEMTAQAGATVSKSTQAVESAIHKYVPDSRRSLTPDDLKALEKAKGGEYKYETYLNDKLFDKTRSKYRDAAVSAHSGAPGALRSYGGSGYDQINNYLRGHKSTVSGSVIEKIKHIDAAMAKAPPLPEDIVIVRRVGGLPPAAGGNPPKLVGTYITDPGFVSTSTDRSGAMGGSNLYRIFAPKGSRGMWMNAINTPHPSEMEYLLPRGARFKVLGVHKGGRGWVFDLEYVGSTTKGGRV